MANHPLIQKTYYKADEIMANGCRLPMTLCPVLAYNSHGRNSRCWAGTCVGQRNPGTAAGEPGPEQRCCPVCARGWAPAETAGRRDSVAAQIPGERGKARVENYGFPVCSDSWIRLIRLTWIIILKYHCKNNNILNKNRIHEQQS